MTLVIDTVGNSRQMFICIIHWWW